MGNEQEFENIISLGCGCEVAAGLSKYGLRSFSGPFDWIVSGNYENVIYLIENDFKDFLLRENLEMRDGNLFYTDKKFNFAFMHDKMDSTAEYDNCYAKYQRRINNFKKAVKKKTLFVRKLSNQADIDYASDNSSHIIEVLKKSNPQNEVLYVIPKSSGTASNLALPIKLYVLGVNGWPELDTAVESKLRRVLETSSDLDNFLVNDIAYSPNKRYRNLMFDFQAERKKLNVWKDRYDLLLKIEQTDFSKIDLPSEIAIYSAGNLSKVLYKKIKEMTTIKCFIDRNAKEPCIDNIPIVKLADYSAGNNTPILVTITYDYENVVNDLRGITHTQAEIISLDEFLK